jgi:hypothetical protein
MANATSLLVNLLTTNVNLPLLLPASNTLCWRLIPPEALQLDVSEAVAAVTFRPRSGCARPKFELHHPPSPLKSLYHRQGVFHAGPFFLSRSILTQLLQNDWVQVQPDSINTLPDTHAEETYCC